MSETNSLLNFEKRTTVYQILCIVFAAIAVVALALVIWLAVAQINQTAVYVGIAFTILSAAAAVGCFGFAHLRSNVIRLYRSYSKVLGRDPDNAVDMIAESGETNREKIVENFAMLEQLGFFDKIFIDKERQIVNACKDLHKYNEFICPVCGGKTLIEEGKPDICEFCGALKEKEKEDNEIV